MLQLSLFLYTVVRGKRKVLKNETFFFFFAFNEPCPYCISRKSLWERGMYKRKEAFFPLFAFSQACPCFYMLSLISANKQKHRFFPFAQKSKDSLFSFSCSYIVVETGKTFTFCDNGRWLMWDVVLDIFHNSRFLHTFPLLSFVIRSLTERGYQISAMWLLPTRDQKEIYNYDCVSDIN
jgi:hypothetical protein